MDYTLGVPVWVHSAHHVMVLDGSACDDCVGNKCSDFKAKLTRRRGRMSEQLTVKEKRVIRLQEVDDCRLAIARERAAQH